MSRQEEIAEWEEFAARLETQSKNSEEFAALMRRRAEHARRMAAELRGETLPLDGAS